MYVKWGHRKQASDKGPQNLRGIFWRDTLYYNVVTIPCTPGYVANKQSKKTKKKPCDQESFSICEVSLAKSKSYTSYYNKQSGVGVVGVGCSCGVDGEVLKFASKA